MKVPGGRGQARFWQVPHLDNVELLHASNITYDYPRHIHEEYCVVVMLYGVETHVCRGRIYEARKGDVMMLNADEAHSSKSRGTEYRIIHIHPRTLSEIASELAGRRCESIHFSDPVLKDPDLFGLLLDLHLRLEETSSALEHQSEFISAVGSLLTRIQIIRPSHRNASPEPRVKLVQDYLKTCYAANVSLSELAQIANLSPFHLARVFRKQVGVPPHEYQTQVRITRARKLIRKGCSISETAVRTGFFDQSHMSRNFKRIVGVTPGQYSSHSNIVQYRDN